MNALAQSPWFWFPLVAVLGAVYLLPTIIGSIRQVEGLGWLVLFNVFFPGIGFLAGLILAFGLPRMWARKELAAGTSKPKNLLGQAILHATS